MFKKLIAILAGVFIIYAGCATIGPQFPTDKGYCTADPVPEWMCRDFAEDKVGAFGLLKWFGWQDGGTQYHMLAVDSKLIDENLDGECDVIGIMYEVGTNDRYGPGTPLVTALGASPCDKWDTIITEIKDDLRSKGI